MEDTPKSGTAPETVPVVVIEQPITSSSNEKRNWKKWILIYIVIAILLYGGVYYFFLSKQTSNPYSTNYPKPTVTVQPSIAQPTTTSATSSPDLANAPLNTKESIDYHFKPYPYGQLTNSLLDNQLKTFTDNGLNISFKYPQAYSIYSINSDSKYKVASVFLLKTVTPEKEKVIEDELNCDSYNRKTPSGVCSESLLSDSDITVTKVDKYPAYDEDKNYDWEICQKEIDTKVKVIYSCRGPVDAGRYGYNYYVYLNPFTQPTVLHLATLNASDSANVIKSVIDSFSFSK